MNLVKVSDGDFGKIRRNFQRIDSVLFGINAIPTFAGITLSGLTASQFVMTDANKALVSEAVPLIVAKGGTGVVSLTDHGLLVGSGTAAVTILGVATNGQIPIGSTGTDPVLAEITGTANQVTVTSGAGSITLSLPQDIHTGASPQFARLGIGTGSPLYHLSIVGGGTDTLLQFNDDDNDSGGFFISVLASQCCLTGGVSYDVALGGWIAKATEGEILSMYSGILVYYSDTSLTIDDSYTPTQRFIVDSSGNFGLGQEAFGTNAVKVFAIGNGTAPSSSSADCFQMYSADFAAGQACTHFRNEDGVIVKLNQNVGSDGSPTFAGLTLTSNIILPDDGTIGVSDGVPSILFDNSDSKVEISGILTVSDYMSIADAAAQINIILHIAKIWELTSSADNTFRKGISLGIQVGKTGAADYTSFATALSATVNLNNPNTQDWTNAFGLRGITIDVNTEGSTTGTITGSVGILMDASFQDSVTVTNYYGIYHDSIYVDNNKLVNSYGIYLENFNSALTLNYAIYTNAGLVRFGDDVSIVGNLTLSSIAAEATDVDKFLVDSTGVIKYRTGAQVLSDIGGQSQGDVLDDLNTLGANSADGDFLVGTGAGVLAWESPATARISIGLGTENTPTFAGLNITNALTIDDTLLSVVVNTLLQPIVDSTTFFQILDADGGTAIFTVDSTNKCVGIRTAPVATIALNINGAIRTMGLNRSEHFIIRPEGVTYMTIVPYNDDGLHWAARNVDGTANGQTIFTTWANRLKDHDHGYWAGHPKVIIHSATNPDTNNQEYGSFSFFGTGSGGGYFEIRTNAGDIYFRTTGGVGIGESAPETQLEMTGVAPYVTFHNSTHEDSDGGRESRINFKGEQSGGEETTLAKIEAGHDGVVDDQKGYLDFFTNDGDDGDAPTKQVRIAADGGIHIVNIKSGIDQANAGAVAGELYFDTDDNNTIKMGV